MRGWVVVFVACLGGQVVAQDNFPDVPENHHVYRNLAWLKAQGIIDWPSHGFGPQLRTKDQLAAQVIDAFDSFPGYLKANPIVKRDPIQRTVQYRRDVRADIKLWSVDLPAAFRKLVPTLNDAIRKRGRDPEQLLKQFEEQFRDVMVDVARLEQRLIEAGALPRFQDVPDGHWASEAIQELRDEGIFVGYSDGKFRGERTERVRRRASDR